VDITDDEHCIAELRDKFILTFEGLISGVNLDRIWEKSCGIYRDPSQLYDYAEETAFEFFEEYREEDDYQDSETSEELDSITEDDGWFREWELTSSERPPLLSSPSHAVNGVPAEMVPEDVMWDGGSWICKGDEQVQLHSVRQGISLKEQKRHVKSYPCKSVNIVYTHEFDKIIEIASECFHIDFRDSNTWMAVLGWVHEINVEMSSEWGDRLTTNQDELSTVWIIMGYKLRKKMLTNFVQTYHREWLPRRRALG